MLRGVVISLWVLCCAFQAFTQATQLGTQTVNGSYTSYSLIDQGIFRQVRIQAASSAASGTRNFEFYEAPFDYDPAWRSYTAGLTLSSYNATIPPVGGTASALFNTGFGGSAGLMRAITAGNYYTFNVTEYSTPGTPQNEYMGVLETTFNPVSITSVTQTPPAGAVYPENSVYVTVTTSAAPAAGEYVYVRYSTAINFSSSTLLPVTMVGTTGTVEIPCNAASTTIYYYAFTSNRTSAVFATDVATYGQVVYDMNTLSINNNGGPNYSYTVLPSVGFCGSYYVPSTCYPTINSFVTALNAGTVSCSVTCYVAAGHTETAPAGGITLTQTGTAGSTITFIKNGAGANPVIYAPVGTVSVTAASTVLDGIFSLNGSDYITIDGIDLQDNNTTGATMMEYGYALFKASATNGCQNNIIRNCAITLNNSNFWTGSPVNLEFGSTGILMRNSTRTAITSLLSISSAAGRSDNNAFYSNTITNVMLGIVAAGFNDGTSPYSYYDQNNQFGISGAGNTINKYGNISATVRSAGVYAIYNNNLTISDNVISNYQGGGTAHNNTLYGVFVSGPITGNYLQTITVQNNTISIRGNTGSSRVTAIKTGNASCGATLINIDGNTIEDCTFNTPSTGEFYGIDVGFNAASVYITNNIIQDNVLNTTTTNVQYLIFNNTTGSTQEISGNQLLNNYKTVTSTSGIFYGYYSASASATGAQNFHDNIIDGFGIPTAQNGSACAVRISTSINQDKQVYYNTISNMTCGSSVSTMYNCGMYIDGMTAGDAIYGNSISNITASGLVIGFNLTSASLLSSTSNVSYSFYDNVVDNFTTTSTNTGVIGVAICLLSAGGGTVTCYNNEIKNLTTTATFSGYGYGFYLTGGTSGQLVTLYNNKLENILHTGTTATTNIMIGVFAVTNGAITTAYGNSISNVRTYGTSGTAYGFYISNGNLVNVFNNFVQKISAPYSSNVLAVRGIYVTMSPGSSNVSYNTVAIGYDAPLSSTAINFGFTGVDLNGSVATNLNNNIIYARGTANGTGLGTCVRLSSPGTAYTPPAIFSGSNNNYYYINNATYNYIFCQGSFNTTNVNGYAYGGAYTDVTRNLNNDECFNVVGPGTGLYKTFMSPAESNTHFDVPPFVGGAIVPDNLKLVTGSTNYAESNASVIAGVIIDYEGDARSGTTPDVGADEGDFVVQIEDCYLLPVELLGLTGWNEGAYNALRWTTATEQNSDYFEVERSVDGLSFITIGNVAAAGFSTTEIDYAFNDDAPVAGINYYRLRMVDLDGTFTYSNTIAINVRQQENSVSVFPNPASDIAHVVIHSDIDQSVQLVLTNTLGEIVMLKSIQVMPGETVCDLNMQALPSAPYFLQVAEEVTGISHNNKVWKY